MFSKTPIPVLSCTRVNRLYKNYATETSERVRNEKIEFLHEELNSYKDISLEKAIDSILKDENIKKFPTIAQIKNYIRQSGNT